MKKLNVFLLILIVALACMMPMSAVFASTYNYFKIVADDVVLYSDEACTNEIILLPNSYFVENVQSLNSAYRVKYHDVAGYVKKDETKLIISSYTDQSNTPYYNIVNPEPKIIFPTTLASDISLSTFIGSTLNNVSIAFIGKTSNGNYYVKAGEDYGYVASGVTNVTYNPTAHPVEAVTPEPSDNDLKKPTIKDPVNNLTRTLLIIAICILSVLVVFLIFKPVKHKNRYSMQQQPRDDDYGDDFY